MTVKRDLRIPSFAGLDYDSGMDVKAIRRTNLTTLIWPHGKPAKSRGEIRAFADKVDVPPNYISQILSGASQMGHSIARKIEQAHQQPVGWMDQLIVMQTEPAPVSAAAHRQTFSLRDGSEMQIIERFRALPPESKLHIEGELAKLFYQAQAGEVFQPPQFPKEALVIEEKKEKKGYGKETVPTTAKDARTTGYGRHAKKTAG